MRSVNSLCSADCGSSDSQEFWSGIALRLAVSESKVLSVYNLHASRYVSGLGVAESALHATHLLS